MVPVKHGRPIRPEDFDWDVSYRYIHFNTPSHELRGTGLKQPVALDANPTQAIRKYSMLHPPY